MISRIPTNKYFFNEILNIGYENSDNDDNQINSTQWLLYYNLKKRVHKRKYLNEEISEKNLPDHEQAKLIKCKGQKDVVFKIEMTERNC